jgi:hypothetical protein
MSYHKDTNRNLVVGLFRDQQNLDKTVKLLKSRDFKSSDISILIGTKAPEGATTGATTGAVAGGLFGWLVAAEALTIPGLGPFIAAGPLMAAIAGAGLGGTVGGVAGGLIGLGIPEFLANRYEEYIKEGAMLISVHIDDDIWETRATKILEECGASNIANTSLKKYDDDTSYTAQTKMDQEFDEKRTNPHA